MFCDKIIFKSNKSHEIKLKMVVVWLSW